MILRKNWIYISLKNWIYINLTNPFKTINKLKGIFKPLKRKFYFNKGLYAPILWCPIPAFIQIISKDVMWKDKEGTPRFEESPYIWIHIFNWNFIWKWEINDSKLGAEDDYWEQALWYLYYYNTYSQGLLDKPNIEKARENWPWQDCETKKSTWNNKFLIK